MARFDFNPDDYAEEAKRWNQRDQKHEVQRDMLDDADDVDEEWVGLSTRPLEKVAKLEEREVEVSTEIPFVSTFDPSVMIIPHVIASKSVQFPGSPGAGKSVVVTALACHAARLIKIKGLWQEGIRPKIVFLSERPKQIANVLYGFRLAGLFGDVTDEKINERLSIRKLPRMQSKQWERYIAYLVKEHAELQNFQSGSLFIPPIIIIDTLISAVPLGSEDANAEMSSILIDMERGTRVPGLAFDASLWILDHTPKSTWDSGKAAFGRGAGAKVGEADQVVGIHRHLLDETTTLLELLKPPREGMALPMMKIEFASVEASGVDILGKLRKVPYWYPARAERFSRKEYQDELDEAKGDGRREQGDKNLELDKRHAEDAFKRLMKKAVEGGSRGLILFKAGKKAGKKPDGYAFARWEELHRTAANSRPWAMVHEHVGITFKADGMNDECAYWVFSAENCPP